MKKQNFLRWIKEDNIEFFKHLLSDLIKIFLTIGSLKVIFITVDFVFTEEPMIIRYMEMASQIGILLIFVIYVASDTYEVFKKRIHGGST